MGSGPGSTPIAGPLEESATITSLLIFAFADANPPAAGSMSHVLSPLPAILFVLLGSLALLVLDLLAWARLSAEKRGNLNLKDPVYWLVRILLRPLAALIVGLVFVYGDQPLTTFTAVALGAAGSDVLERILKSFFPTPSPPSRNRIN
jgi:hypothetical protein